MEYDPLYPQSLEQAQQDKAVKARLIQGNEDVDLKWLMGSKRGRRIVWRLMDQAGVFRPSFNTDAALMSYHEGYRAWGTYTLTQIFAVCPDYFSTMLKEAKDEHNRNANTDGNDSADR
jgi:hypothetical protein